MTPPIVLGELQFAVMRILWNHHERTAQEIHKDLQRERTIAFTTVATVLSRLDKQGVITHRLKGRTYIYSPLVNEDEVQRSMLDELVDKAFRGDPVALVSQLLEHSQVSRDELTKVKALIKKAEKKGVK